MQCCIQETLLFLSYTRAEKQGVDFIFKDIGRLVFCRSRVQRQFSTDSVHSLSNNVQLLKSQLNDQVTGPREELWASLGRLQRIF